MVLCFCSYTIMFLLVSMELMISGPHLVSLVLLLELLVIDGVLSVYWHQHVYSLHVPRAVGECVLAGGVLAILTLLRSLGGYLHPWAGWGPGRVIKAHAREKNCVVNLLDNGHGGCFV